MSARRIASRILLVLLSTLAAIAISACSHSGGASTLPSASTRSDGKTVATSKAIPAAAGAVCRASFVATPAPSLTYQQLILGDGPLAYYQLADSAATLTDSGPNGISGAYGAAVTHGAKAITAGASMAANFPGGSSYNPAGYAYTPKNALLQPTCPTLEAWFSLSAGNATNHDLPIVLYGSYGRGARYGMFVHGLGGDQCLQVQLRSAGVAPLVALSHARLYAGSVYHVVAAFDGLDVALYINGVLDSVYPYAGNVDYSPYFTDGLQIGGGDQVPAYGSASFPGTIAQVAVYSEALQALQVQNHYLAGRIIGMLTETPANADKFVDSFALNTHFENPYSIYATSFAQVSNLLIASGIRHVRAGITYVVPAFPSEMEQLAASGVHASYVTTLSMTQAQIQSWPSVVGASFEQYEPPNEQDDVGNANWLADCIAFQKNLYSWVKTDPQIARYSVLAPAIVNMANVELLGSLSPYLDAGNIHDYFIAFNPGTYGWGNIHPPFGIYGSISYNMNIGKVISGQKPMQATETGYGTLATNPTSLDYRTHLRYMTRLFFEQFNNGIMRSYSYELMDEGGSALFNNFGLVTTSLQPKPAYTGIQSLINLIKDPGPTFTTTPLTYEVSGFTDPVHHTLLQKRNGHYLLAIWLEVPDWVTVNNAGGDIIVAPQAVTLMTAKHFSSASIATMNESGQLSSAPLPWTGQGAPLTVTDKVSVVDLAP